MPITFKTLLGIGKTLRSTYFKASGVIDNRTPFIIQLSVDGIKPSVVITLTNKTANLPIHVHEVRVHYGNKAFSRALRLFPFETVSLTPKTKCEWSICYEPEKTIIVERTTLKEPPKASNPNKQPGIESPGQLFNAIGMGEEDHSWIEVDFNEYTNREFLRGEVKSVFDAVGKQLRELRELKSARLDHK